MPLHTGEQWALDAGEGYDPSWCPRCKEWVDPESERDEDGIYVEWCPQCGETDLQDDENSTLCDWREDD